MVDIHDVELMFLLSRVNGDNIVQSAQWVKVDIDRNTTFSFNLQASDITDPTAVKIPFSYQVDLPKTNANTDIFSSIGIYDANLANLNAIERTEFRLYINGSVYQVGYFKLEQVTHRAYKIRLYGGLGDYFYEMSDTTAGDDTDMYMRNLGTEFGTQFNHTINRNYIINNWRMRTLPANSANASSGSNNFFGYAMTYQGQYPNFDSDTELSGSPPSPKEATWEAVSGNKTYSSPVLTEHRRNVRLSGSTVATGYYVSYYQRPMVRLSKLFDAILSKLQKRGWTTIKDSTFFNASNPYWNDVWCILPQYNTDGEAIANKISFDESMSGFTGNFNRSGYGDQDGSDGPGIGFDNAACQTACNIGGGYEEAMVLGYSGTDQGANVYSPNVLSLNNVTYSPDDLMTFEVNIPFWVRWVCNSSTTSDSRRHKSANGKTTTGSGNSVDIKCRLMIGGTEVTEVPLYIDNSSTLSLNNDTVGPQNHIRQRNFFSTESGRGQWDNFNTDLPKTFTIRGAGTIPAGSRYNGRVQIEFLIAGDSRWFVNGSASNGNNYGICVRPLKDGYIGYSKTGGIGVRSGSDITFEDIMQSNETCAQFLLSYCKSFGMYFVKDPIRKQVTIMTRNTYYGKQERLDWTKRIDYSRDWIEGIANFDYKIGLLKWRDTDTKYEKEYYDRYNKEYGSVRVQTGYGFSDVEKDYFSDNIFSNCIIATAYDQYFFGRNEVVYKDNKTIPYLQDTAGDATTDNFILVFRDPENIRSEINGVFMVADDIDLMLTYGYSWVDGTVTSAYTTESYYPTLRRTIIKNGETTSLYFGAPAEYYSDEAEGAVESTDGSETIYNKMWARYLNDRFDKDAKTLTCYVYLTVSDIQSDLFRKFIFINNTCWVLNRIIGFNPLNEEPTKCELIKVQEIDNYLSQSYIAGRFQIRYPAGGNLIFDSDDASVTDLIQRFDSSAQNVTFSFIQDTSIIEAGGWEIGETDRITVAPMSSTNGTTTVTVMLPENNTGSAIYWQLPVRWGNSTTIITLVQVSNWNINTSGVNGTSNASGGGQSGASIQVTDGTTVTLTTTGNDGYVFGYWEINGEIVYNQTVTFTANNNIDAVATWLEAGSYGWQVQNFNVTYAGGIITNDLTGPDFVTWGVTSDPALSNISPVSGQSDSTVSFTVPENDGFTTIVYTVSATFGNGEVSTFAITQTPSEYITIDPENVEVNSAENTISISVDSNADWTVSDPTGSLTITPSSDTGSGTVSITVPANPTSDDIVYTVTFTTPKGATSTLTITQSGFTSILTIDPETITINGNLNQYVINVTSNTGWVVINDPIYDAYFTYSPNSGTGNGQVTVTVSPNVSSNPRTGELVFVPTDDSFTVTHEATQLPGVGAASVILTNSSGSDITFSAAVEVQLVNQLGAIVDQYTIRQVPQGSTEYIFENHQIGNYVIQLSSYQGTSNGGIVWNVLPADGQPIEIVAENTNSVTYGVNIGGSLQLVLTPGAITVGPLLNNFTARVFASAGVNWELSDNVSWLSCTPTSGAGGTTDISVTVQANLLGNRQGVITVNSTSITPELTDKCEVSQTGIL